MDVIELLRQVGLTQYEAEAYSALVREGPLTGYELGKRSRVPLPRSYDVVERLAERGLALVQPGDPPRYRAEDPDRFLARLQSTMAARLEALDAALSALAAPDLGEGFWVVRGRESIRERIASMIRSAEQSVAAQLPPSLARELEDDLTEPHGRGCRVSVVTDPALPSGEAVLILIDGREVAVGTLAAGAQVVVSQDRLLAAMAQSFLAGDRAVGEPIRAGAATSGSDDWLDWENEKHRRLRLLAGGSDVA